VKQGSSYVQVPIVPLSDGTTVFTVTSLGLATAKATLQVGGPGVVVALLSSKLLLFLNQTATLTVSVAVDGQAVTGARVSWTATAGTVSASNSSTDSRGHATATFSPASTGLANVAAIVSSPATGTKNLSVQIQVIPTPHTNRSLLQLLMTFPYYILVAAAVAGAVIAAVLGLRRRGRGEESDEETESFMIVRLPRWPGGIRPGF
jgi:hypothetical protein